MRKLEDVCVRYYKETSKKHSVAYIGFRNKCADYIRADKVKVVIEDDGIFFVPDESGYSLTDGTTQKIQLWAQADELIGWEGCYPLEFNINRNVHWIRKGSVRPIDTKDLTSRLGETRNYTPHYGKKKNGGNEMELFANEKEKKAISVTEAIGNVSIFYKRSYKSETVTFTFTDGAEVLGDRVYIESVGDRINFEFGDKGFRLNEDYKAEIWNGAHRFALWNGNYKLKKDDKGYFILKEDCVLPEKQGNIPCQEKPRKSKEEIASSILKDLIIEAVIAGNNDKASIYAAAVKALDNKEG